MSWYRRAGAELPFRDPARERGAGMEGTFWRFTRENRVTIVLHGRSERSWSLIAVAHEPGGVEWEVRDEPIDAGPTHVRALGFEAEWTPRQHWPRRSFGALGPAQAVPWLGQYWHPHLLRGETADGALVYAEKNWGSRFAGHWWWGQAHLDGATAAFAGGRLFGGAPTALVVAVGERLFSAAPPLATVTTSTAPGRWRVRSGAVELEAEADPARAHALPVPAGGRQVQMRSRQHLTGRLAVTIRRRGGIVYRSETLMAGLERGYADVS